MATVEISPEKRAKAQQDILAVLRRKFESSKWEYYKPSPKQKEFHEHRARCRGLITANQFGKTTAGVIEAIWHAQGDHQYDPRWNRETNPNCVPNVGWVVALDRTNLADQVIIPEFKHWMTEGRWTWSPSDYKFTDNRTGSEIWIKSADSGREKFQGAKIHWAWVDEEPGKPIKDELMVRLIAYQGDWWVTVTPLLGMTWLFDEIFEPWQNGDKPESEVFVVTASLFDNPYLPDSEKKRMEREYESDPMGAARLYGEFTALSGRIYPEFGKKHHILPSGWKRPAGWKVVCGIDFGFANPFCNLWGAIDGDGALYIFDEHYQEGLKYSQHVKIIKKINEKHKVNPSYYVADPEDAQGRAELRQMGIPTRLADKKFMEGLNRTREYMHVDDVSGKPRLFVHPRCKNLIWELGRYVFKERSRQTRGLNPHEIAEDKDNHACDALRYIVMTRPSAARLHKKKKVPRWSFESWMKNVDGPTTSHINPTQV